MIYISRLAHCTKRLADSIIIAVSGNNAGTAPMQLIGMLDSPYVRRVAISLQLLGLRFEHHSVSVFSTFEQFRKINPVVKAPTLICDDGTVLMDSTLMIQYAEAIAASQRTLV